jgi:transposase
VSFIGKIPVYIEGRNGNSNAVYKITETIERSIELLKESGIKINKFRSDSAAYRNDLFKLMDDNNIDFFVRAKNNKTLTDYFADPFGWTDIILYDLKYQMKSIDYGLHGNDTKYRLVMYRTEKDDKLKYLAVITNNWTMSEHEIIRFYNQRGAIEKNFDMLKNDFNWKRLPFSFLNENTVFMIISAMGSIVYQYLIQEFSKKVDFVKCKFRLKNFIYHFVIVPVIWEKETQLKIFTDKDYGILLE